MKVDFCTEAFFTNPHPTYHYLRERAPAYWYPFYTQSKLTGSRGMWVFSRYDDVAQILRMGGGITKVVPPVVVNNRLSVFNEHLLDKDPPDHTRMRAVVENFFSARSITAMDGLIHEVVDFVFDNIGTRTEFDFIAEFALQLPLLLFSRLMGVPFEDLAKIRQWSEMVTFYLDSGLCQRSVMHELESAEAGFIPYFKELIDKRRSEVGGDLLSLLITANDEGKLSDQELLGMAVFFIFAGHESTADLLGTGLYTLCSYPEQLQLLQQQRALLPTAIEEMMRFESPAQRGGFRVTTQGCQIGEKKLQAGEQVCALISAANRDPRQFRNADSFDITRQPNRHLAFGSGIHTCLGNTLARRELRIAFERLLDRWPNIKLTAHPPKWAANSFFRRIDSLWIRV
ncbi:MAG: cytochrome P450 [Gammaproteobacteria bacterium]|nr:cytochrome P450 [Gammaproteobacteria bacterium]